jgi:ribosome-binding factor A
MTSQARAKRVGDRIREELADLIHREVADPRLRLVTVTDVDVDRELAFATIYVVATGSDERSDEVLTALEGAKGFLRSELAHRIDLRNFPQLRFRWDYTEARGARIDELLDMLDNAEGGNTENSEG